MIWLFMVWQQAGISWDCFKQDSLCQEWLPTFELAGHENLPNYDYSKFLANPHDFLEDKFLDVGRYANAMELYKENLDELRDQLKIKVS